MTLKPNHCVWVVIVAVTGACVSSAGCSAGEQLLGNVGDAGSIDDGYADTDFTLPDGGFSCGDGLNFKGCPCVPGQKIACYTGSAATRGVGLCKDGTQLCVVGGKEGLDRVFGDCIGSTLPSAEQCDGLDHDCDGAADEGCACTPGTTRECAKEWASSPPCHAGTQKCADGAKWGECEGAAGPPPCGGKVVDGDAGGDGGKVLDCSLGAPRLIAPLSTSTVTSKRPTLRWELATGTTGGYIQLCADRACKTVLQIIEATGTSGAPAADLPTGVAFFRAFGASGTKIGCTVSATWEFFVGARSAPVDTSWGSFPDPNGDGYADALVGDSVSKTMRVYPGGPTGISTTASPSLPMGLALFTNAGDVDGDGFSDVLTFDFLDTDYTHRLYRGGPAGLATTSTLFKSPGFSRNGDVSGDFNGDGYGDVVLTNQGGSGGTNLYVYSGSATGLSATPTQTIFVAGYNGSPVCGVQDVNGDGFADVVLFEGTPTSVQVFLGGKGGLATSPVATLSSDDSAAAVGDVNGDGYADTFSPIVGTSTENFLVSFGSAKGMGGSQKLFIKADLLAGHVGDINGDGFEDALVVDWSVDENVLVYLGGTSGLSFGATYVRPKLVASPHISENQFLNIQGIGDVNGDHFRDVLMVGEAGVYLVRGSPTGLSTSPPTLLVGDTIFWTGS